MAVLMVDFSCALKLAIPVSVLAAMREANARNITVKGGKYLEACAQATTIVFDKTGTLTKAEPKVVDIIPFSRRQAKAMLRVAACLEEHFPHSMAKAVVRAAEEQGLVHKEMHQKVEYIVAHGIASRIGEQRVVIGSYHFVFEDEGCVIPEKELEKFRSIPEEYSQLYMAIDGKLSAVICIQDPLRDEALDAVQELRKCGFTKIVMMTGDNRMAAASVAKRLQLDDYRAEVLPEDKAAYIRQEKEAGRKVVMVGDGINDSPALSAADVGIAISDGAAIAREIADVTIAADDLFELAALKKLSARMMKRINHNYRVILGFNGGLIAGGVSGLLAPTTSSLLHNGSTLYLTVRSMMNYL